MKSVIYRKHAIELTPEMATARMRGLRILFSEGKSAEQLWIYAATGELVDMQRPKGSPGMRGDAIKAWKDFRETFTADASREQVLTEAVSRLRSVSLAGVC